MHLECTKCEKKYPCDNYSKCEDCGGILLVKGYDYERFELHPENPGIWKYIDLLPLVNNKNIISLSEGTTPVVKSSKNNVYFKLESSCPTGSFKDRGVSVMVSKAVEDNIEAIAIASSGNASAAVSAYTAKAGIKTLVYVPKGTPDNKISQAAFYGAEVYKVNGVFTDCYNYAKDISLKNNYMNSTTTFINPYNVEGNKTMAYEIYEEFGIDLPNYIFIPLGAGPVLYGIYLGFKDLVKLGKISSIPKLVGVQTSQCSPIVDAFEANATKVNEWNSNINTIASAITDSLVTYSDDGTITLEAIYDSEGLAMCIAEKEISFYQSMLAKKEGIFCEPSSAVAYGGYLKLLEKGVIKEGESALCLITGNGLKQKIDSEIITHTL